MKAKRLILILASTLFLSGCSLPFIGQKSGIQVTANPQANVFLNDKPLGQTPVYQEGLKTGTYNLKISSTDSSLAPWEGKVTLNPGALTVVDRQLTADPAKSSGYVLTFETLTSKTAAEANLVSFPDTVSVMVDGAPVGFTPFKSDSISAGPHVFTLTTPGYQDFVIKASVQAGHRLVINASLGAQLIAPTPTPEATPSATPSPTPSVPAADITPLPKQATSAAVPVPYVLILDTPTKFLRVRNAAQTDATEVAKVNPGDRFPYLSSSTTSPVWYQIEYLKGMKGWVISTYAKLVQ